MRPFFGLFLLLLLSSQSVHSQTYFNRRYQLTRGLSFFGQVLPNGPGYLALGSSVDTVTQTHRDNVLAWLDSLGSVQRIRLFSDPNSSYFPAMPGSLMRLRDGSLAQVIDQVTAAPARRPMLWRFNAAGDTLWTRTYSHPTDVIARNGCRLANGDFVLVGACERTATASLYDWFVLRTDSLGRERWRGTYRLLVSGEPLAVLATPDGGVLVTGFARRQTPSGFYVSQMGALKLDAVGATQWQRTYDDSTAGWPAVATADGGYLVSGSWRSVFWQPLPEYLERPALYKLDAAGNLLWRRRYGPAAETVSTHTLHALADGSYVLAGSKTDSTHTAQTNRLPIIGFALKVCADGDSVWYREYRQLTGIRSNNYLWDLIPTPDGGFAGAGFLHPRAPDVGTRAEAWLFKTDANGYVLPGGAPPTVQCAPVGVGLPEAAEPAMVEVWPNPAADGRFTVGGLGAGATLTVCDALGRVVWRGVGRGPQTGVDLSHHPPGLYLLRVAGKDGRIITKKLLR